MANGNTPFKAANRHSDGGAHGALLRFRSPGKPHHKEGETILSQLEHGLLSPSRIRIFTQRKIALSEIM